MKLHLGSELDVQVHRHCLLATEHAIVCSLKSRSSGGKNRRKKIGEREKRKRNKEIRREKGNKRARR
jgi:hypothetical protein